MKRTLLAGGLLLMVASAVSAQKGQFVVEQAGAQVATEEFTRTPTGVTGAIAMINGVRIKFDMTLAPDATAPKLLAKVYAPTDTANAASTLDARFTTDSLVANVTAGENTMPLRLKMPAGTVPYVNPSAVFMEQIIRRAKAIGGTEVKVFVSAIGGSEAYIEVPVSFTTAGEAKMNLGGVELIFKIDADGAIQSGTVAAQNLTITRK